MWTLAWRRIRYGCLIKPVKHSLQISGNCFSKQIPILLLENTWLTLQQISRGSHLHQLGVRDVGRLWLTLEYVGDPERLFRCIAGGSGESDRLFHSLRKRLDRHVFPLLSRECSEGTRAWREIER